MKKSILTAIAFLAAAAAVNAQGLTDALIFSENDYYGSARTMGMGNAVTAVGSDLGSMGFNPAGSAVAKYSQVSITPGLSISSAKAYYDDLSNDKSQVLKTKFTLPHVGASIRFDTGRADGLKCVTVGFSAVASNNFNSSMSARATTSTSYAGSLADFTRNCIALDDNGQPTYMTIPVMNKGYDGLAPWESVLAYKTGLIRHPEMSGSHFWGGVTEDFSREYDIHDQKYYDVLTSHPVNSEYSRTTKGNKTDYIINLAFNFSDFIFFGANLGIQSISYSMETLLTENVNNPSIFQSRFKSLYARYNYSCSGNGFYGKFGILATPVAGLRLGATFTTPTMMTIAENWTNAMSVTTYADSSGDGTLQSKGETPLADNRYGVTAPMRFSLGAAYTFGSVLILSADYEFVNYGSTRFKSISGWQNDFRDLNRQISGTLDDGDDYDFLGASHLVRAGAEIRPFEALSVRLGYNFTSCGEKYYENGKAFTVNAPINAFSFGIGYSSSGSFFADLACRLKFCPRQNYLLYNDYHAEILSPEVHSKQLLTTVMATVGWRF